MAGRLASTRKLWVTRPSPRKLDRARPYAARNEQTIVSTAAQADAIVLVASSCQKVGSAMPISRKWSMVIDPVQDGGRVLLSGSSPNEARAVQASGTRKAATAAVKRRIRMAASRRRRA